MKNVIILVSKHVRHNRNMRYRVVGALGVFWMGAQRYCNRLAQFLGVLILFVFLLAGFPSSSLADDSPANDASSESLADASQRFQTFSDSSQANQGNLVLFVKFKGDDSTVLNDSYCYSDGDKLSISNYSYVKGYFNTNGDGANYNKLSLQAYLKLASGEKYNVTSVFPQEGASHSISTSGGSSFNAQQVDYITLDHEQTYYASLDDESLVADALEKLDEKYPSIDSTSIDRDSNGDIDDVTFVFQLSDAPSGQSDVFWPHMSSSGRMSKTYSVSGKALSTYNFLYTLSNPAAYDEAHSTYTVLSMGMNPGVVVHEYLHTLGLGDYYDKNNYGIVAPWEIMGNNSYYQFMLANTRQLLGWTTIPNVEAAATSKSQNADGSTTYTCTLQNVDSSSGQQAVEVTTAINEKERFVFEYRKTNPYQSPDLPDSDPHLLNSGLIVYRVNDSVTSKSNFNGSPYYVYLFRPGDTSANSGAGDTYESMLETADYLDTTQDGPSYDYGARTTFGSSDMSATVKSSYDASGGGTIYYSDGSNSGITVKITGQSGNKPGETNASSGSITFELTVPDYTDAGYWSTVGSAASTDSASDTSLVSDSSGSLYQAYEDSSTGSLYVRKWDGSSWTVLGTVASGSPAHPQLVMVGDALYCVYASYPSGSNNAVVCKKWTGSEWADSGTISTGTSYSNVPAAGAVGSSLYVLVDTDNASPQVYKLAGSSFSKVGAALPISYALSPQISSLGGSPCVVVGDYGTSGEKTVGEQVYVFNGSAWSLLYSEGEGVAHTIAAASTGSTLITLSADPNNKTTPVITKIDQSGQAVSYDFDSVGSSINVNSLFVEGNYVYASALVGDGATSMWHASLDDLSTWTQLGKLAKNDASSIASASDGSSAYIAATTTSSNATVVSHDLVSSPTQSTYSVTFKDYDGSVLKKQTGIKSGEGATAPSNPSRHGYTFTGWDRSFESVTADIEVTAQYSLNSYSIVASSGAGGSISPSGTSTISFGASQSYAIVPSAGYEITDVLVDGKSVGACSSYAFVSVDAEHSISATFSPTGTTTPISSVSVEAVGVQAYTGHAIEPTLSVTSNGATLTAGVDYSVTYRDNTNPGTATITLVGLGSFTGSRDVTFTISPFVTDLLGCGSQGAVYTVHTSRAANRLVDIAYRSTADGGNAWMCAGNETPAQRFLVCFHKVDGDLGYYTFENVYSEKVLDVAYAGTSNGTNVQQCSANGTAAQQWVLSYSSQSNYYVVTNVGSGKVLDIAYNSDADGANLQIFNANGTSAQMFAFEPCAVDVSSTQSYAVASYIDQGYVFDVAYASTEDTANIQLYQSNSTDAQRFRLSYEDETGYYVMRNVRSDKVLDVAWAGTSDGANVWQYSSNGTWAQKWSLKQSGTGYVVYCAANGLVLDLSNGNVSNGSNVQCWSYNGTDAQKWCLVAS